MSHLQEWLVWHVDLYIPR